MVTLEARNLTRTVDGRRIVDDVSLTVRDAELLVVAGPSGAGKTSLLRLLDRLDEPTSGRVLLDGVDAVDIDPRTLRRRVGLVPQSPGLWDGTVRDNVTLGPRLRGETVDEGRVAGILDRVGLVDAAERAVGDLSGGEAERVAFARTLLNDPEVLLLDEPTANLDARTRDRIEALLLEVLADRTAILVTHDTDQARRLGDRVLVMEAGRIVDEGVPEEVLA